MALWTPYVQEVALDLSKSCVKTERASPTIVPLTSSEYLKPLQNTQPQQYADLHQTDTQLYENPQLYRESQNVFIQLHTAPLHCEEYQNYGYVYQPAVVYDVPSISPDSTVNSNAASRLSPSVGISNAESLMDDPEYQVFERDALRAIAEKNGGTLLENNPRMRRSVQSSQASDDTYRKQRERNNYAAKQSRDRRKLKEMRLALQVTFLKKKLVELKATRATGLCGRCNNYKYP